MSKVEKVLLWVAARIGAEVEELELLEQDPEVRRAKEQLRAAEGLVNRQAVLLATLLAQKAEALTEKENET